MSKVFSAHAVSVDGYITGRGPGAGRGLGDGTTLFDWYFDGDTPSQVFDGFRLREPSARAFDALAGRVGAVVAGRNTYEDSDHVGGAGPHPTAGCSSSATGRHRAADPCHRRSRVPVWIGTHGDHVAILTGPDTRKARNLRSDPRVALSLTPADNPFQPVIVRGRVVEWLEGDAAWEIVDQISTKYTGGPTRAASSGVVALIEPDRQSIG